MKKLSILAVFSLLLVFTSVFGCGPAGESFERQSNLVSIESADCNCDTPWLAAPAVQTNPLKKVVSDDSATDDPTPDALNTSEEALTPSQTLATVLETRTPKSPTAPSYAWPVTLARAHL